METARLNDRFYNLSRWSILLLAFLLPFWFLPITSIPVEFSKVLLVSLLTITAFIFYLVHAILRAKISIAVHKVFLFFLAALLFWFLSSVFSGVGPQSLWGTAAETSSFFNIFILFIAAWLITVLFSDKSSLKKLFLSFFAGFAVLGFLSLLFIFGFGKILGGVFAVQNFNTIGSWNSIALASGFFIMMIFSFLSQEGPWKLKKWVLTSFFGVFIFIMLLIGFPTAWLFLGVFSLIYLSYAIWRRRINGFALLLSIFLLSVSVFGFTFKSTFSNLFGISSPVEVGISHSATFGVLKNTLKENIFFGKGPASFRYIWDVYKPNDVNQTAFWAVRFDIGSSYLLSLLGEIGIIGWILFTGFLGYLWYAGLLLVSSAKNESLFLSSFFLFSYTILMWALYPIGYTLLALGFLSIGFLLASLRISGSIKVYNVLLFGEGPVGFVSAMVVVLFMIAGISGFYITSSKYIGHVLFSKAAAAFSNNDLDLAEKKLLSASRIDSRNGVYMNSLSQVYILKSQLVLQDTATPSELLSSRFKDVLDKSISAAQKAILLSPLDFESYRGLGNIYRFLVSLNVAGAKDAALAQFDEAIKRSPKNPSLFKDKALAYLSEAIVRKDNSLLDLAQKELEKSVEIKPDYDIAHFLLAQIFDAKGNSTEAIKRGEAAALISPNDVGTLFQLGLLYYKNNRLQESEAVLKKAVLINPNYSNARYFLGLIYDKADRQESAILEFEKISSLNPGNEEVVKILSNLHAGKPALSTISPPGPSPEERVEAPLKDRSGRSLFEK